MIMPRALGRHVRDRIAMAGCLVLPIALVGCSHDDNATPRASTHAVQGSVLLPDGKPLAGGTIHFVPTADGLAGATGLIHEDGTFHLSTYGQDDGAAVGTYKIRVEPDFTGFPRDRKGAPVLPFHHRYTDEDTSEWTVVVKAGGNDLPPFRLEKKRSTSRRDRG